LYFNENKSNTNIDDDFKNKENILSKLPALFNKYKIIIFILIGSIYSRFPIPGESGKQRVNIRGTFPLILRQFAAFCGNVSSPPNARVPHNH
jgi:hypothetical protein